MKVRFWQAKKSVPKVDVFPHFGPNFVQKLPEVCFSNTFTGKMIGWIPRIVVMVINLGKSPKQSIVLECSYGKLWKVAPSPKVKEPGSALRGVLFCMAILHHKMKICWWLVWFVCPFLVRGRFSKPPVFQFLFDPMNRHRMGPFKIFLLHLTSSKIATQIDLKNINHCSSYPRWN